MVGLRTLHDVITKVQPKRKQPTSKIDKIQSLCFFYRLVLSTMVTVAMVRSQYYLDLKLDIIK